MDFSASKSSRYSGRFVSPNSRGARHGDVAIDESRALSPASCNAAKKVLGRALRRAMREDLIYRKDAYIADGIA